MAHLGHPFALHPLPCRHRRQAGQECVPPRGVRHRALSHTHSPLAHTQPSRTHTALLHIASTATQRPPTIAQQPTHPDTGGAGACPRRRASAPQRCPRRRAAAPGGWRRRRRRPASGGCLPRALGARGSRKESPACLVRGWGEGWAKDGTVQAAESQPTTWPSTGSATPCTSRHPTTAARLHRRRLPGPPTPPSALPKSHGANLEPTSKCSSTPPLRPPPPPPPPHTHTHTPHTHPTHTPHHTHTPPHPPTHPPRDQTTMKGSPQAPRLARSRFRTRTLLQQGRGTEASRSEQRGGHRQGRVGTRGVGQHLLGAALCPSRTHLMAL